MKNLERLHAVALLFMRCVVGIVFLYHGYPKLAHPQVWTHAFLQMGFPSYFAYISGILEAVGGMLLIFGLATRVSGALLAVEMAVAVLKVDMPSGSLWQVNNYELSLLLTASAFILASLGSGDFSLDYGIAFWRSKETVPLPTKSEARTP